LIEHCVIVEAVIPILRIWLRVKNCTVHSRNVLLFLDHRTTDSANEIASFVFGCHGMLSIASADATLAQQAIAQQLSGQPRHQSMLGAGKHLLCDTCVMLFNPFRAAQSLL
jgi:hypothetical protein